MTGAGDNLIFPRRRPRPGRLLRALATLGLAAGALSAVPTVWVMGESGGRVHRVADAPTADVAIVFGAQLAAADHTPLIMLAERLDAAVALVRAGKVKVLLLSGDGHGTSGDEPAAMTKYLVDRGVDPARIVTDPAGLDSYDTCARARQTYGVSRALLISQGFHLPRAIALCRHLGVDADGVDAGHCATCTLKTRVWNPTREYAARAKALLDLRSGRAPAVASPPTPAVATALAGL
ncbi:ElyC/SanA/YdcF family protein [Luedemannella flava]|uniref:ElyC/SanA/YdcF family protein n=1 Tax=Luedemannella flava TaxID=349316 RepID=A0ABN2M586_9ACTN